MLVRPWQFQMLGRFQVQQGDRLFPRFRTGRTAALLAYLAYHPEQAPTREHLLFQVWPEASEAQGRVSLRSALASLRRQLEPPGAPHNALFLLNGDTIQINPASIVTDAAQFERAWQQATVAPSESKPAALKRAVELYSGELLPGHFEEWVHPERERLELAYQHALLQLAHALETGADPGQALLYAQLALRHDALSQEAHHAVMRLYAASGQPSLALRQYRHFKRLLHSAGGGEPADALRELARQLRRSPVTVPASPAPVSSHSAPLSPPGNAVPASPPSAPSASTLPAAITPFFGREDELRTLLRVLAVHPNSGEGSQPPPRLITLTGPGGIGKTRLALEAARRTEPGYEDAVWFAPLADTSGATQAALRIHEVLRLPRVDTVAVREQIVGRLMQQPSLLVLDNFDTLIPDDAAESAQEETREENGEDNSVSLVRMLLATVPRLRCVVTSRQRLGLQGEQEIQVAPLPVPLLHAAPADLMGVASVQLFVQRSRLRRPDFAVTPRNAAAIADLCARLEGIPLALELAAARTLSHTPSQMVRELGNRFDFLISRYRDVPERHQTLRATIAWSYHRLSPEMQRFFARLSVFRDGWTPEAAQAVTQTADAVHSLERLCDQSFVVADAGELSVRFRMLETLREYAESHLSAGDHEETRERHAGYFLAFVEEADAAFPHSPPGPLAAKVEAEYSNILAALTWCVTADHRPDLALRFTRGLSRFWPLWGRGQEGQTWLERALACSGSDPANHAAALHCAARYYHRYDRYEKAMAAARKALAYFEAVQDTSGRAHMLALLGALPLLPMEERLALLKASLTLATGPGDAAGRALALDHLGRMSIRDHTPAQRLAWLNESMALYQEMGDSVHAAHLAGEIGYLLLHQSHFQQARRYLDLFVTLSEAIGDPRQIAHARWLLGSSHLIAGRWAEAEDQFLAACDWLRRSDLAENHVDALYRNSLGWARIVRGKFSQGKADLEAVLHQSTNPQFSALRAGAQERLGLIALWRRGDRKEARRLLQAALKTLQPPLETPEARREESGLASVHLSLARLECYELDFAAAEQHVLASLRVRQRLGSRLGQVQCLEVLAQVAAGREEWERAALLLAVTHAQREQMQAPPFPFEMQERERIVLLCQSKTGSLCREQCLLDGAAVALEEIVSRLYASASELKQRV